MSHLVLSPTKQGLKGVSGNLMKIVGEITVCVIHNNRKEKLNIIVMKNILNKPILGRKWLARLWPRWKTTTLLSTTETEQASPIQVNMFKTDPTTSVINIYSDLFSEYIYQPTCGYKVQMELRSEAHQIFRKYYNVPFHLREQDQEHLKQLKCQGVIQPIEYTNWATPLVIVKKKNGEIRLC